MTMDKRKSVKEQREKNYAEVAEGEFINIPSVAREAFHRPAFAYTKACPDERFKR